MQTISYKRVLSYLGRNRYCHMVGIEALKTKTGDGNEALVLTPINNRGVTPSCYVEIPVEQVQEVVAAMLYTAGIEHFEFGTKSQAIAVAEMPVEEVKPSKPEPELKPHGWRNMWGLLPR